MAFEIGVSSSTTAARSSHQAKNASTIGLDFCRLASSRFVRGRCRRRALDAVEPADQREGMFSAGGVGAQRLVKVPAPVRPAADLDHVAVFVQVV